MSEWNDFWEELLQDSEVQASYDAHAAVHAIARAVIIQRIARNLTQQDMAARMQVSQDAVSRLESGTLMPTISTLQRAACALGVPLEIRFGSQVIPLNDEKA